MFERILVPLDGSAEAEAVFVPLRRLLRRTDSDVTLLHALPLPAPLRPVEAGPWLEGVDREATEYLERIHRRLESEGIRVTSHLRPGRPADVILDGAAEFRPS